MTNRLFIKYVIFSTLVLSVVVAVANFIVDPYGKNNVFSNGFNEFKIVRDERVSKYDLLLSNPDAGSFIFGSSRGLILDPDIVEKFSDDKALNIAFSSATAEEYYLYIKFLFETRDVNNIVIGIDLFAYANGFESTGTYPQELRNYFNMDDGYPISNYLSFKIFKHTIKTIKYNLEYDEQDIDDRYTKNGKIIVNDYIDALNNSDAFEYYINRNVVEKPARWATRYDGLDPNRLASLNNIKRLCVENDTNLYLFTSPLYIKQITSKQNKFYLQKDLLRYIVRNVGPVLDMNNILKTNQDPRFFIDNFHYSYGFADSILMQLLTGVPTDDKYEGMFVDKKNLEAYIGVVESRLEIFISDQGGSGTD